MPTSQAFTFIGVRNLIGGELDTSSGEMFTGFPFTPDKIDVSSYDYWSTLGGTTKGNAATQEQIDASLQNAVSLFWNLYQINSTFAEGASSYAFVCNTDTNNTVINGGVTPYQRMVAYSTNYGMNMENVQDAPISSATLKSIFYGGTGGIVKMYDGATTNESNFVGYGVEGDFGVLNPEGGTIRMDYQDTGFNMNLSLASYGNAFTFGTSGIAYTTISGFPFVCGAVSDGAGVTANATNRTLSVTDNGGVTITLNSLDFYTY